MKFLAINFEKFTLTFIELIYLYLFGVQCAPHVLHGVCVTNINSLNNRQTTPKTASNEPIDKRSGFFRAAFFCDRYLSSLCFIEW